MHRAIRVSKFGGPEVLKLLSNIELATPSASQVLVKVKCSGVNPVDTYIREGAFTVLPDLPYTPGKDAAGVVQEVGTDVKRFKKGDRVFLCHQGRFGTLADYVIAEEQNVFHLGEELSFAEGAALGVPYLTAYRALYILGKCCAGKRVLVHGATGAVGQAAVKLALNDSIEVVGTAGSEEGVDYLHSLGVKTVYNHRNKDHKEVISSKESGSFDIILEMLANVNLETDLGLLRQNGIAVVIGCRGDINISPRLLMKPETSIIGCSLMSATPDQWAAQGRAIEEAVKDGSVRPKIFKKFTLEEASAAHEFIMNGEPTLGHVVIDVE